ncbi:MAG: hypothetical protein ACJ8FN_05615 [Sphingomicrobium sp.]
MAERGMIQLMAEALELTERALALVDEADVPADIGACLDHARVKLDHAIERMRMSDSVVWAVFPKPAA